ncbi:MAG: DedA family protein [Hyphomicrobiaceae bacterium]
MLISEHVVHDLAAVISHHRVLGSVAVFMLAFSESIPVIGVVAPGTAVILAISVMSGLGYLPLAAVFVAALLGAIAGDGISFWFGMTYRHQALRLWPISRYPRLIASAQRFFARHGGKSIALARFTPVVRAFVPMIAGISGMSARRFYIANVLSALAWASSHILPAAAAGASIRFIKIPSGVDFEDMALALAVALAVGMIARSAWLALRSRLVRRHKRTTVPCAPHDASRSESS